MVLKSENNFSWSTFLIPILVSSTENSRKTFDASTFCLTLMVMLPQKVNFNAFDIRFSRICFSLPKSDLIVSPDSC